MAGSEPLVAVAFRPAAYAFAAFGLTLAVVAKLLSPRIRGLPGRPVIALAVVLIPRGEGEILITVALVHFFLAVLLALLLIQDEPRTRAEWVGDLLVLVLLGLPGPDSLVFLPLFFLRLIAHSRSAYAVACTAVTAACACIQVSAIVRAPSPPHHPAPLDAWLETFARHPMGSLLRGKPIAETHLGTTVAVVMLVALLALLGILVVRQRERAWALTVVLGAAMLIYASAAYRFIQTSGHGFEPYDSGDRYFFLPKLFLVWVLVIGAWTERSRALRALAVSVLGLAALAAALDFVCMPHAETHWAKQVQELERGDRHLMTVNPAWIFDVDRFAPADELRVVAAPSDIAGHVDILLAQPVSIESHNPFQRVTIEGRAFLMVHPPGKVILDRPLGSRDLTAEFAIRPEAYELPQRTDGAEIRVDFAPVGGAPTTLWRRVLRPMDVPEDRGPQTLHISLPQTSGRITLLTPPPPGPGNLANAWTCWARVRFD